MDGGSLGALPAPPLLRYTFLNNIHRLTLLHLNMVSRFPRGGTAAGGRIERAKIYVIPFTDHSGQEALMVFRGVVSCPLPPLYSFAIYFTHPEVTPDTVKPAEVLEAIMSKTPWDPCPIRLELYFLSAPNVDSSDDDLDCIAHYRKEKAARGDYIRHIQDLENSATDDEEQQQGGASVHGNDQAKLPGLVPSYIDSPSDYYHGIIFRYPGTDWYTDNHPAHRICFDQISEEEYACATEGNDEFYRLPLVHVSPMPFQESDTTYQGETFVGMAMFDVAHARVKNETGHWWHEARERGWKSW
ncbi:hypothetical protein OPT61_g6825 [Boeremia exigua]|uniref:Uncharacterized protein n=1 Tax=Boeremia exigua TaxID=749465 RepID=A0ACC2I578_9PLEO|nr:hypothetical protein OPT61_g6825 [Boeremia exigua]